MMIPTKIFLSCLLAVLVLPEGTAQSVSARLLDAQTQKGIPYATVEYGPGQGVITNAEGRFSFVWKDKILPDSIHISCLGYGRQAFAPERLGDGLLFLEPSAIALQGVYLFDRDLAVEDIIERMVERLPENLNASAVKQRIFLRHSILTHLERLDMGFEESSIAELDKALVDSMANSLPREAQHHTESLLDLYKNGENFKLHIIKAAALYNKDQVASLEELGKRMEGIFRENIKRDSYLKIKSGLFSQKVPVDSILGSLEGEENTGEAAKRDSTSGFLDSQRYQLGKLLGELYYRKDSNLDLIHRIGRYAFTLSGYAEIDGEGVYVVDFAPKRSKVDFKGRLFINIGDFGVMRLDFENTQRLRNFRLLGITYREEHYAGSARFTKLPNGRYELKFLELTQGNYLGVDRPLKVVEKNKQVKGRRKQNELSLNLDLRMRPTEKWELVVFDQEPIDSAVLTQFQEDKGAKAHYMPFYDPGFWEGHTIIEPNQALRAFRVEK